MSDPVPPPARPFRWRNCHADIEAAQHDLVVLNYMAEVIRPAIATLDRRIEALGQSDDAARLFYQSDLEDVRRETLMAFALALQSIWERQFRQYVTSCARELADVGVRQESVRKADWGRLCKQFRALRGIAFETFPSSEELDALQLLGMRAATAMVSRRLICGSDAPHSGAPATSRYSRTCRSRPDGSA